VSSNQVKKDTVAVYNSKDDAVRQEGSKDNQPTPEATVHLLLSVIMMTLMMVMMMIRVITLETTLMASTARITVVVTSPGAPTKVSITVAAKDIIVAVIS
jgi:hypothetical protein